MELAENGEKQSLHISHTQTDADASAINELK